MSENPQEPIAYLNGKFLPASQAAVAVSDVGFLWGVTVAEQLRTFGGKLFRLEQHLARLDRSLEIVGVDVGLTHDDFRKIAVEIVEHNFRLLSSGGDLGLTIFITPGAAGSGDIVPPGTVCLHTRPLPFSQWAAKYEAGESLATTGVVQVSDHSWPPELKCRSRAHYYLADRQAAANFPGARAVMCDEEGFVTEATTANILVVDSSGRLISPPREKILPGISLSMLLELASALNLTVVHQNLLPQDLTAAAEILLCSTSPCILPVTKFNGQVVGNGRPGKVYRQLLSTWSNRVGVHIDQQAIAMQNA